MMRTIEFEYDSSITSKEAHALFEMLDAPEELPVFQVDIEKDDNDISMYIFIENGDPDYMREDTFQFLKQLANRMWNASISDEDYGGSDVIIVDLTVEHLESVRRNIENEGQIKKMSFKSDTEAIRKIDHDLYKNGWDLGRYNVCPTSTKFHEFCDEIIFVYIGKDNTYIVVDNTDFGELLIFKMDSMEYYAKWELFVKRDLYFQDYHRNEWVWFNIGQSGDYFVQWQDAIINANFDSDSLRVESFDDDGNTIWVKPDDPRAIIPKSVDGCFDDPEKVAELVEKSYWEERNVHVEGRNSLHIRTIFDMNDKNEYGLGRDMWE